MVTGKPLLVETVSWKNLGGDSVTKWKWKCSITATRNYRNNIEIIYNINLYHTSDAVWEVFGFRLPKSFMGCWVAHLGNRSLDVVMEA